METPEYKWQSDVPEFSRPSGTAEDNSGADASIERVPSVDQVVELEDEACELATGEWRFERYMLLGAIGVASLIVLIVVLFELHLIPLNIVRSCGEILIFLCAALFLLAAGHSAINAINK